MSRARWPYPRIAAHRGGGSLAPENTLAGLRLAASLGFRGVEFDVMLAGDGTPVLIHDETLERTTDGRGRVDDKTWQELAALDAGAGEPVPRFEDAARLCLELGLWANIEIKPSAGQERETGEAVAKAARRFWQAAALLPVLSSFSSTALEAAAEAAPELPRGLLISAPGDDWRARLEALGCFALHCNGTRLASGRAAEVSEAGYALVCYAVNDAERARRLLAWGVDCLITDRLDLLGPRFPQP